jgi:D-threo-aldose 1-dehydrogenase
MTNVLKTRRFARGQVEVTELGLGTAPLGGMYSPVSTADCLDTLETSLQLGIRYIDTAPMYGSGRVEHLTGQVLRDSDLKGQVVLSTKVGRLMRGRILGAGDGGQARNPFDSGWANALPFTEVFDYSYDAILRSFEDSQQRLGFPGIDILLVHDIGRVTHGEHHQHHWTALTTGGGFRALQELRAAGCIRAFGLGTNEWEVIAEAMDVADLDCFLLAGRYTLLDQSALVPLLGCCAARGVSVLIGGVFNSGILVADDAAAAKYNYAAAPDEIRAKAQAIRAVAARHSVAVPAAAVQLPLAHPAVVSAVVGARCAAEVRQAIAWRDAPIPDAFWHDLRLAGLLDAATPIPA